MRDRVKRFGESLGAGLKWVSTVVLDPLGAAWYPTLIALASALVLAAPGLASAQIYEALYDYQRNSESGANFNWPSAIATFLALLLLTSTLRYWTARLLGADLHDAKPARFKLNEQMLVSGVWLLPWAGAAFVFAEVAISQGAGSSAPYFICALLAIVLPALDHFAWRRSDRYKKIRANTPTKQRQSGSCRSSL